MLALLSKGKLTDWLTNWHTTLRYIGLLRRQQLNEWKLLILEFSNLFLLISFKITTFLVLLSSNIGKVAELWTLLYSRLRIESLTLTRSSRIVTVSPLHMDISTICIGNRKIYISTHDIFSDISQWIFNR